MDPPLWLPARPPGPGAASWYAASDLRFFLVAIRTLVLQVAHPMVGAAVGQHSVYKTDPYGRLWRTATSVIRQVFGGYRTAEEGQRLLAMHREITGVDDQGRRYSARNPAAYVWVHATLFDAWRLFLRDYARGLSPAGEEQLFDEWRRIGLLIGCEDRLLPGSIAEYDEYFAQMLTTLEDNEVVQDLLHNAPKAPPLVPQWLFDLLNAPLLRWQRSFVAETVPPELAGRFGLPRDARTARHARLLGGFSKLLGLVPGLVRRNGFASWAMWRTSRDPRITPEPLRYP
ncbi:oxygenase MpaB family protein [Nocardioides phosphati]|uniref:oxygenase MpaB family protein n=1 Tax=Nocardioides phosphati TaxID=1867775 RepID=UPI0016643113|nr:oxygenase MpaB family protein [Nocardioides phosphati]